MPAGSERAAGIFVFEDDASIFKPRWLCTPRLFGHLFANGRLRRGKEGTRDEASDDGACDGRNPEEPEL